MIHELVNENYILVSMLDQETDLYLKRWDFMKNGELGKVKFIDEKIMPSLIQKENKQILKIKEILGKKNENEKRKQTTVN